MDITIFPGLLRGTVSAIPSKSQAHRLLICSAFADRSTELICPSTNRDIEATADCLQALGAGIVRTEHGYTVTPISKVPEQALLPCGESGSTLRFLLPIAGALGTDTIFRMEGRLPQRPLSPLWEEMERMGCILSRPEPDTVRCRGRLHSGAYSISGSVSSQYISGLLFALSLLPDRSSITITGRLESGPYVAMTQDALNRFGICTENFCIPGNQAFRSPGSICVEGDWSNAAFFLAATAMGNQIAVTGLNDDSCQGDRAIAQALAALENGIPVDAAQIPDLIPILAIAAGARSGGKFTNIQRLRLKESDRVQAVLNLIRGLGGSAQATEDTLTVQGTGYRGGTVSSAGDHRIAMAAAIAATVCTDPVTILGADAVKKSYPGFWEDYRKTGGSYEQYIR